MKEKGASQADIDAKRAAIRQEFAGLKDAHKQMREQIKAVLTPDQVKKFEAMKASHHHHRGHGGAGNNTPNQTDKKQ